MNGINFLNLEIASLNNHSGRDHSDRIYTDGEIKAVTNALQEIALQYKGTGYRVDLALYGTTKRRTKKGKKKKRGIITATLSGHFLQRIFFQFNPKTGKITGRTYGESKLYEAAPLGKFLKPATPADHKEPGPDPDAEPWNREPIPENVLQADAADTDDGTEWLDAYQDRERARREQQEKNEGATE